MALVQTIETALAESKIGIDRFFFDWAGGARRKASVADEIYEADTFADFRTRIAAYAPARSLDHPYWSDENPVSMPIETVEALWSRIAEHDDWSALDAQIAAIRRMGEAMTG